ncbi:hypothetical protein ACFE04_020341 [Oxalis oulophora]
MKRGRENFEMLENVNMDITKCLMLLSQGMITTTTTTIKSKSTFSNDDVFKCKTCNKKFSSFQALGGHRASHHKKTKLTDISVDGVVDLGFEVKRRKMHECSICGLGFSMGQALGGHMRKHRDMAAAASAEPRPVAQVLRRSNSVKRVVCLDLNLTPLENDMEV